LVRKAVLAGLVVSGALAPLAAHAQSFTPPEGCALVLTVQMRQCQLANHLSCTGDTPGDRWVVYTDAEGIYFTTRIDYETRWLESYSHITGVLDVLDPVADDHASFSTLLQTGFDDYDFWTQSDDGFRQRHVGHDKLTGEPVIIDGVALERATFELTSYDAAGQFLAYRSGTQFVSREWRIYFGDTEVFENAIGERFESALSPVTFSAPGEPGFGASTPLFDCNSVATRADTLLLRPLFMEALK